jgi:PD-(D/E)XK nuclease superfamily protein
MQVRIPQSAPKKKLGHSMSHAVSPSQMKTADDCLRMWGYQQIDGIRSPGSAGTELGTLTHAQLERYFQSIGTIYPDATALAGRIANSGLALLPKPRPLSPEWPGPEFQFNFTVDGCDFRGTIDLPYVDDGVAVVLDHKTLKDFRYCETSESLKVAYQRIIYSVAALRHFDTDLSRADWIYYGTIPPHPSKTVSYGPEPADETLGLFTDLVLPKAKELVRLRKFKSTDLPQNFQSCGKYGGCSFRERCHGVGKNARDTLNAISTNAKHPAVGGVSERTTEMPSLFEQLKAQSKTIAPPPPIVDAPEPAAPTPAVEPAAAPTPTAAPAATTKPIGGGLLGMFGKKPEVKTEPEAKPEPGPESKPQDNTMVAHAMTKLAETGIEAVALRSIEGSKQTIGTALEAELIKRMPNFSDENLLALVEILQVNED